MKKAISILLVVAMCCMAGCFKKKTKLPAESSSAPASSSLAEPSSQEPSVSELPGPEDAVAAFIDVLRAWDSEKVEKLLQDTFPSQNISKSYFGLLEPVAKKLEYQFGNAKLVGDKAEVDVAVTATDMKSALNAILKAAAAHVVLKQALGDKTPADELFADYAAKNIEWDKVTTIKTDVTVYLVLGADGAWKVDATNSKNLPFLNALSGGAIDFAASLQAMLTNR